MQLQVRVVHLKGCGATPEAIERIRKVATAMGLDLELEEVVISTPEEAARYRHIGSPTVQVNGLDIDPSVRNVEQYGLT